MGIWHHENLTGLMLTTGSMYCHFLQEANSCVDIVYSTAHCEKVDKAKLSVSQSLSGNVNEQDPRDFELRCSHIPCGNRLLDKMTKSSCYFGWSQLLDYEMAVRY